MSAGATGQEHGVVSPDATAGEARPSYWGAVWLKLAKNRIARFGVWSLGTLFALAVAAPLISSNQALLWSDAEGLRSPLLASLFNRLFYESSVDVYFNLWLALLPPVFIAVWIAKRALGPRYAPLRGRIFWGVVGAQLFIFALVAPEHHFLVLKNPAYHTAPVVNYRTLKGDAREDRPRLAWFPPRRYSYQETEPTASVLPPGRDHWLGTDTEGRDVFARMLFGTRISLTIGVVAVSIYVAIGVFLGALAGYFGGWIDNLISRLVEVMICFPSFFLILTLAALIEERSIFHVMLIIGLTRWTDVARLIRAEFLKHRQLEYAQAALALGARHSRVIFRHILPNAIAPVLVSATFGVASAILIESSLSFLGVGDATVPSWGETLNTGRVEQKLWLVLAPGFAIFFVVSIFNLVGEGLRDALDPKLRS